MSVREDVSGIGSGGLPPAPFGYKKFPWALSFAVRLQKGIQDNRGKRFFPERTFGTVIKNNFHGLDPETGLLHAKPYLFVTNYDGVMAELKEPWGSGYPIGKSLDICVEQAKEWITPTPPEQPSSNEATA